LEVDGQHVSWGEGKFVVFDDSYLHSAANHGDSARIILHIAFPHPELLRFVVQEMANEAPLAVVSTQYFNLSFFRNCTAQTVSLMSDGRRSSLQPIATLYNKVADGQLQDNDKCTAATIVSTSTTDDVPQTLRLQLTAAHGYGSIDVDVHAGPPSSTMPSSTMPSSTMSDVPGSEWLIFRVASLAAWHADPIERHIQFGVFGDGILDVSKAPFISGKFQGQRGSEGLELASSGFFTLSSVLQSYNLIFYAKEGHALAYTLAPTNRLQAISHRLLALPPSTALDKPNPNRMRTWYWTRGSSEANLDMIINRTRTLGAELVFFLDVTTNIGDYVVDSKRFPSGFAKAAARVVQAGLRVGIHIISPGACHKDCTNSRGTTTSELHPELFVPQGLSPRSYYPKFDAGTWWCHEKTGDVCHDKTRPAQVDPMHPEYPPPNHMNLTRVHWSALGQYRDGGALGFDGNGSYGRLAHTAEYDFNKTMTLQMVVHPLTHLPSSVSHTSHTSTLAAKFGSWSLGVADGRLRWEVQFAARNATDARNATVRVVAIGKTVLAVGSSYVVKATANAGVIQLQLCMLTSENMGTATAPEMVHKRCQMAVEATNSTAASALAATGMANGDFGDGWAVKNLAKSTADIFVGADFTLPPPANGNHFVGAIEELYLAKVSLEDAKVGDQWAHCAWGERVTERVKACGTRNSERGNSVRWDILHQHAHATLTCYSLLQAMVWSDPATGELAAPSVYNWGDSQPNFESVAIRT
jgi:hypothetical protein